MLSRCAWKVAEATSRGVMQRASQCDRARLTILRSHALAQLFAAGPPLATASTSSHGVEYQGAPSSPGARAAGYGPTSNTLDEPISDTIKRDLKRIWKNLVMVVFPFKDRSQQSAALRNWDLWGPMVRRQGPERACSIPFALVPKLTAYQAVPTEKSPF